MSTPQPSWRQVGRHAVFPEASHDEIARFDFLTRLNLHLSQNVLPGVKKAWETRVKPAFEAEHGRAPADRHEVRRAMQADLHYQLWSALRRNTMEMRQQAGRSLVFRQLEQLRANADALNEHAPTLQLDPAIEQPRYQRAVDIHCMPGSYHGETVARDIAPGANYDAGLFVTTAGALGRYSDGGGQAVVDWLHRHRPGWRPQRILDIGCTIGHNALPLAQAFPEAEVVAVDTAAPVLRYGHARARSLGVANIVFRQADGEALPFDDGGFDLVTTAMFWHETSNRAMPRIMAEVHRVLAPGGLTLHLEQPQYAGMDPFEAFMRDWDTYNNNEPFWTRMHEADLDALLRGAGFPAGSYFETTMQAKVDRALFPAPTGQGAASDAGGGRAQEDYGRSPVWTAFGAQKPQREETPA
ncbi:MAG: methyltransferase domain-containing protein [Rubrivivax sp.]|nr:class I SAM-dependent methyltransferase [Rubrivivax sp.]